MRCLNILTWHIHGSYLNTLARIKHNWYLPVKPGRPEGYGGRGPTFDLPDYELNAAEWIVYDALYAYCQQMTRQGKLEGAFR